MAVEMAATGQITSLPAMSNLAPDVDMNTIPSQNVEDDDDSSSSSNATEIFDKNPTNSNHKPRWPSDVNGSWSRYGSSDSAASTAVSSICSSSNPDELSNGATNFSQTSRKRYIDGTPKPYVASPTIAPTTSSTTDLSPPPKKKRGRPPKAQQSLTDVAKPLVPSSQLQSTPKAARTTKASQPQVRPRSSIPSRLPADVYASQCLEAAYSARLDPYSLHSGEHSLLGDMVMTKEITVYLNLRNAILRLWSRNPLCAVTLDEALGCARESRFFGLAETAYRWLSRQGYINFGCVQPVGERPLPRRMRKDLRQRTVVVIGAGVAGLSTARQLENLFIHEAAKWEEMGEQLPKVVVLEGRKRIGGRVYSKPFRSQVQNSLPDNLRNAAEMGAMIVTGFEHGNPLDAVIRGQLGLRYHLMRDSLTIYDCDGRPVEEERDMLNTELYTDISDRAGYYRDLAEKEETLKGDEELINRARDPVPDGFVPFQLEALPAAHIKSHTPSARRGRRRNAPPGTEKLTGRSQVVQKKGPYPAAVIAARDMGWSVRDGLVKNHTFSASAEAVDTRALGPVMDDAIIKYQDIISMRPLDLRLLNWHHANLEYANAAPISSLSLSGHDQDTGNEFEGAHSEIIGGYSQLPRGLMNLPSQLDVRFDRIVESIHYDDGDESHARYPTRVVCTDGEVIEADEVVLTVPLGVLKAASIDFDPPLPPWKQGAIQRMGFGLLNKVVLLYDKPFWDEDRDMFGLLNESEKAASLDPADYERRRGRFYLIWNCSKTSGRPMLIALMAGQAAHDAEITDTNTLLSEITERLRGVFKDKNVPAPLEVVVTRWKRDPFTRGTYSFVGPDTHADDYNQMARPVGNVHFAGEATCGTHPATVHGAFLSGLRAAAEVIDDMAGLVTLPNPLVGPQVIKQETISHTTTTSVLPEGLVPAGSVTTVSTAVQIKVETTPIPPSPAATARTAKQSSAPPAKSVCAGDASFWVSPSAPTSTHDLEAAIASAIKQQLGARPAKPHRTGVNPFLSYMKDKWEECRAYCTTHHLSAGRDLLRQTLGKWWKEAADEVREPYLVASRAAQASADVAVAAWKGKMAAWEQKAAEIRVSVLREHRGAGAGPVPDLATAPGDGIGNGVSSRKTNVSNCVVLDHAP